MTFDVAARLAAGRPSVANTQAYVSACRAVGYQHPDLTAHGSQIVQWYGGEDGLDLSALDADCAQLRTAASAADQALRIARDGLAAVSSAWAGESGSVAADFVERHCAAAAVVARALHGAAGACEGLRDSLWRLIDEKVTAAVSIDDRRTGERAVWLAAAASVTSGGAAREEAVDVVTHQITPYVDADIRSDWLTAMRSATDSMAAAYEDAVRQLNTLPTTYFEVPGQWGAPQVAPAVSAPPSEPAPTSAVATPTVPAAAAPEVPQVDELPVSPEPSSVSDTAAAQPLPAPALGEPTASPPAGPASGGVPPLPGVGGGLSGLVGQIADALGGLFDTAPEDAVDDDPLDDPVEVKDDTDPEPEETEETVPEYVPAAEAVDDPPEDEPATDAQPVDPEPAPSAEAPPPQPEPEPEPEPEPPAAEQPAEQTPCEIAADELAQVGQ